MSDPQGSATTDVIRVRLYGATDVGQVREHNEDNFLVADFQSGERGVFEEERTLTRRGAVLGVCDGMGGAAAGEVASQLAVDIVFEKLAAPPAPSHRDDFARRLVEAVEQAGQRIFLNARSDRSHRGMGTTSTIGVLLDERLFLAQVGDSRAYIYRNNALVQVTRDQSLVNQLIEAGQLTEQEADSFEHNNIILQALGTAETVQVDLTYADLRRGDTLLLCSDGLFGMIKADEIKAVLAGQADPKLACQALIDKANKAGGHDNITVIVAKFDGPGLPAPSATDLPLVYRKHALSEKDKRRDTARPGSLNPASTPTPSAPTHAVPAAAVTANANATAHSQGLKVGHTLIGAASPFAATASAGPQAALSDRSKPTHDSQSPAGKANSATVTEYEGLLSAWPPQVVGAMVVCALLVIAVLGFWLLR